MTLGRASLTIVVVAAAALALVLSGAANAATIPLTGTITQTGTGTCGDLIHVGGPIYREHCEGLTETWTGSLAGTGSFDLDVVINIASGVAVQSGTEAFVGCVNGTICGTLTWEWHTVATFDPTTFEPISSQGGQHFTGGTGDLTGASGSVIYSSVGGEPATYEGSIVL